MKKMKAFVSCSIISLAAMLFLFPLSQAETHEGHGTGGKRIFTKHFQETLFDITKKAAFSVEVLLDDKEYAIGRQVIGIVIHDEHDEDVTGAELTIVHKDLTASETVSSKPTVTDKGNGLYIVSGLDLQRTGRWELAITVRKSGIEDSVKFILPDAVKERVPKGRYSP